MRSPTLKQITAELQQYPPALLAAFEETQETVAEHLDEVQVIKWAREGARIAQQTGRAWEAAVEYFHVSSQVLEVLTFPQFLRWSENGAALCEESPTVASSFFKMSPAVLAHLPARYVSGWAGLGKQLCRGTWKSSSLAARFFESSPDLLSHLSYREMEQFVGLVNSLSYRSFDLATECLHLGQRVFPNVSHRGELISLAVTLAESSWREVRGAFEVAARISTGVDRGQRSKFFHITEGMAKQGMNNLSGFMLEATQALARVSADNHGHVLEQAEGLSTQSLEAVGAFLSSVPRVMERISVGQVDSWFQQGVELLNENVDGGVAYFRLESARSEQVLEALSSSVEMEKIRGFLRLYCQALAGSEVEIKPAHELSDKNLGWVSVEAASTDGTSVYLPEVADQYADKAKNFAWLKVVSTHQTGHLEFSSFEFNYAQASNLFEDLRPKFNTSTSDDASSEQESATNISRLFDLFTNRQMGADIFSVVEDARIDNLLKHYYRGLAPHYQSVQADALGTRPSIKEMPLQQAMVELLVRLSLDRTAHVPVPVEYADQAKALAGILRHLQAIEATVEDSAEAALRIYHIISQLPSAQVAPDEWEDQDLDNEDFSEGDNDQIVDEMQRSQEGDGQESSEDYESPDDVDFRGDFKPEMVQLLMRMRSEQGADGSEEMQAISQEMLEELLKNSTDLDMEEGEDLEAFANNLMKEAEGTSKKGQVSSGNAQIPHQDEEGGPLDSREPRSYVYDEWDFRANDYRPRWCVVHEKQPVAGDTRFYSETLQTYAGLMEQIRRQFEMVRPEMHRKARRLKEGEDIDLDAALDAMIDIRSGHSPDDRVYWRNNKDERDVSVAFLLDMSASTAEAVDDTRRDAADWDVPTDPAEYAKWLRTRRTEGTRRQYKRIIDIEKESMVLLMSALDLIGDQYGVYGFSGFGRENVEFYVIKDVEEKPSDVIKQRLDKVAPLHATRMGPAIRHTISKLEAVQSKTKFLFLISDGRPQDRGYSREGVEKEYAVQDTRMALMEARQKDITPFCLTVDRQGHDYLKMMAGDMNYEVLPDITELPSRLPYLYRRLTL